MSSAELPSMPHPARAGGPPSSRVSQGWRPTPTLVRAALVSATFSAVAVGFGRPDLLVLATPFLVHAATVLVRRPTRSPRQSSRLAHSAVREGQGTTLTVDLEDAGDVEHAVVAMELLPWTAFRPAGGVVGQAAVPTRAMLQVLSLIHI